MATAQRIHIVGIGDDGQEGLTVGARELLQQAEVVLGPEPILSGLQIPGHKESLGLSLQQMLAQIEHYRGRRLVVLTTGDPLFFGVARYLCDRLGKDHFEVVPHVSTMQLAFARVKESWDDAFLANLATQPLDRVLEKARLAEKVGLFTTDEVPPRAVARAFVQQQIDSFMVYVCENLGAPDERVTQGELGDIARQDFGPLNVMVLVRKPDVPDRPVELSGQRLFGNPDDLFLQTQPKRGLLTPMEVRVIALAELDLGPRSTVWDVGAGSGAVAIEAARLSPDGRVYAIEMDPDDHQLLRANAERFHVSGALTPVLGRAPDAWESLPDPDAVFVGGTGRAVSGIVELALQRLRPGGRLVANVDSLDSLVAVRQVMTAVEGRVAVRMIQVAHGTEQLDRIRLSSMNPTFLLSFLRPLR